MEGQQLLGHELAQSCNSGKAECATRFRPLYMFYKPATVNDIEVPSAPNLICGFKRPRSECILICRAARSARSAR